ncbi:MAG: hypothetical protein CM1200mP35_08450 [Chloroflexota bacterium]|nr:MAG: hypothetical protein CM1200mP35_08450 [Chloroflexota bacterium]
MPIKALRPPFTLFDRLKKPVEKFLAKASIKATVCSAAATVLPIGAFTTAMPAAVAASKFILSTPIPARAIP